MPDESALSAPARIRWWQWPNVLALDAALIAVGWQQVLAMGGLGLAAAVVLGLSVWLVYTADRWLDARALRPDQLVTARHRFARRWQKEIILIWGTVLVADVAIALGGLSREQLQAGFALLGVTLLYAVAVHRRWKIPKELLVAGIFTAGVCLFVPFHWGEHCNCMHEWGYPMLNSLFLLALGNCVIIAFRERELDQLMGRHSLARRWPLSIWLIIGLLAVHLIWLAGAHFSQAAFALVAACSLGLIALQTLGQRLSPEVFRVLADSLLLLPWVWVGLYFWS